MPARWEFFPVSEKKMAEVRGEGVTAVHSDQNINGQLYFWFFDLLPNSGNEEGAFTDTDTT